MDVSGEEQWIREFDLIPKKILYFNNVTISLQEKKIKKQSSILFETYCSMRKKSFEQREKKLEKQGMPLKGTYEYLRELMGRPLLVEKDSHQLQDWNQDVVTYLTLANVIMRAKDGFFSLLRENAPQFYWGEEKQFRDIWSGKMKTEFVKKNVAWKKQREWDYVQGMQWMGKSVKAFDEKKMIDVYHSLQMAVEKMPTADRWVAAFYLLVHRYLQDSHDKINQTLEIEFWNIKDQLSSYLRDHALLFVVRLQIIQKKPLTVTRKDFSYDALRRIFDWEEHQKKWLLIFLKKAIIPQPAMHDVIYLYFLE
jgi:hypothetical protein